MSLRHECGIFGVFGHPAQVPLARLLSAGAQVALGADDPLRAVLEAQALTDKRVQLLPVLCVWDRAPERDEPVGQASRRAGPRVGHGVPGREPPPAGDRRHQPRESRRHGTA